MDLFKQNDFRQQYELAKEQGDKRFGSPCQHIETKNGRCLNCLRNVVTDRSNIEDPRTQAWLLALNEQYAAQDWQAEEFYSLMAEAQ